MLILKPTHYQMTCMDKFIDRQDAGMTLAGYLRDYVGQPDAIILALPRGGVPVACELARMLSIPLDVLVVRKLGVPGHEEVAMGAVASGDAVVLHESFIKQLHLDKSSVDTVLRLEKKELLRREHLYRGNRPFPSLVGKTVILVDDGMATGASMQAAVKAVRQQQPGQVIIAVPVATREACEEMEKIVDKMVCPLKPLDFYAVGFWYENFAQVADAEVLALLDKFKPNIKKA